MVIYVSCCCFVKQPASSGADTADFVLFPSKHCDVFSYHNSSVCGLQTGGSPPCRHPACLLHIAQRCFGSEEVLWGMRDPKRSSSRLGRRPKTSVCSPTAHKPYQNHKKTRHNQSYAVSPVKPQVCDTSVCFLC